MSNDGGKDGPTQVVELALEVTQAEREEFWDYIKKYGLEKKFEPLKIAALCDDMFQMILDQSGVISHRAVQVPEPSIDPKDIN